MGIAYDPQDYWDARLARRWNLAGVGNMVYSERYNRWLYRAQDRALARVLRRASVPVCDQRVLDVGSGTGHWLAWYEQRCAGGLTGLELSPVASQRLRTAYPNIEVVNGDIAAQTIDLRPFDLVNVISVLYHIVDPDFFERALGNLARLTRPGGWLVLSDWLGAETVDIRPASHVRFRPLALYRERLGRLGFHIESVEGVYTLLNGGLHQALARTTSCVADLLLRSEEVLAPVLYVLDRVCRRGRWANMRMLVARKAI